MKNVLRISDFKESSIPLVKKIMLIVALLLVMELIRVQAQTVTDIDGNVYKIVTIGTQVWMAENLKTTKYNDNTAIPLVTENTAWETLSTPGYCWYNNLVTYKATYGALYNWYAASEATNGGKNVCPTGWHVPTDEEWTTLTTYLGGSTVAGGKLKETDTTHWFSPNTAATNVTGFTALPGGYRNYYGSFKEIGHTGIWWSSMEKSLPSTWYRLMYHNYSAVFRDFYYEVYGFSVRCLRDILTDITNPSISIMEIYPNPVSGILTIGYKNENFETINIINSQGILLTKEKVIIPRQQLDFSKFDPGLYILEFIKTSGEIRRFKVINQ